MKAVTRVSRQDAAARLNVPEATIDRMIRLGDLETEKESHGSKHRIWALMEEEIEESPAPSDIDSAENSIYCTRICC